MSNEINSNTIDRFKVTTEQYLQYQKNGYLIVKSLISEDDVKQFLSWADDLLYGRISIPGIEDVKQDAPLESLLKRFSRIHMLHRIQERAEWGLLHPRILDVLQGLIGTDILALQSMLFFNPPGRGGQGWHQDSYYIPTFPDTLIGAWIALDQANEENGCLWVVPGSHHEPVYPGTEGQFVLHAEEAFDNLQKVENVSNLNDDVNTLSKVAKKYPEIIPVKLDPGDVLFFHSHLLHRSNPNRTEDKFRRAYVCHYSSAHSLVPWNHGEAYEGISANYKHILARGSSHLPYSKPIFGTKVNTLNITDKGAATNIRMMGMENGQMMAVKQIHVANDQFGKNNPS